MVLCLSGCVSPPDEYLPIVQDANFQYSIKTYKDGSQEAYLYGFTESGAEQTHLVLPPDINGIPVVGFGYRIKANYGNLWNNYVEVFEFKSEILERLYIPFSGAENKWNKVFHSYGDVDNCYFVFWYDLTIWALPSNRIIIGYNLLSEYVNNGKNADYAKCLLANVSYMYNYDDAENDGYYWVDCYDNELIKFIPPTPTRDGYTFGGWYKEPECLNAWDFENDKVDKDIIEVKKYNNSNNYSTDDITFLYAKWLKI
jgi:uncharacterized repeat protein (TIGR02543 family)